MKTVKLRKSFIKDFNRLQKWQKVAWAKVFSIFIDYPRHPKLRRHALNGVFLGLESIDVAPDLRALFLESDDAYVFYFLKNHNQLYS